VRKIEIMKCYINKLRCPVSHSELELSEERLKSKSGLSFELVESIPNFTYPEELSQTVAHALQEYDRVAEGIYDVAVDWQFAAMREDENQVREHMVDNLSVKPNDRILEIGCGTGRDSFRLARRLSKGGELHVQDLSPQMVLQCRKVLESAKESENLECDTYYFISNATYLPYEDNYFDSVFHFGGFNEFASQKETLEEFSRVVKPGGKILFGDESVAPWLKGTEYEGIVTTNNAMFKHPLPLHLLPESARDVKCEWVIGNCFYVITFSKGEGIPDINLDLEHQGRRGGSMRSRYFGQLEGVKVETKELAWKAINESGLSMHSWLDSLVSEAAEKLLKGK
jgi:ubiquinone/menaquinone biosynthesis C-methylase UbiE